MPTSKSFFSLFKLLTFKKFFKKNPPKEEGGKLFSKRVALRPIEMSDLENLRLLELNSNVMRFTPMRISQPREETLKRLNTQIEKQKMLMPYGYWVAEDHDGGVFIGWFMLVPVDDSTIEIGLMIVEVFWNEGYGTEVLGVLMKHVKDLKHYKKIVAKVDIENKISEKLFKKLGFEFLEMTHIQEKYFPEKTSQLNIYHKII